MQWKRHTMHILHYFFLHYLHSAVVHWVLTVCQALRVYECEGDTIVALKSQVYLSVGRKEITVYHFWFSENRQMFHVFQCAPWKRQGREATIALYLRASRSNKSFLSSRSFMWITGGRSWSYSHSEVTQQTEIYLFI